MGRIRVRQGQFGFEAERQPFEEDQGVCGGKAGSTLPHNSLSFQVKSENTNNRTDVGGDFIADKTYLGGLNAAKDATAAVVASERAASIRA